MDISLFEEVKDKVKVTWDEAETNKRLERIMSDAISTLNWKLGANIDYSSEGQEHNLFLNYCMYAYNDCTNEFDDNYFNEIMQLRQKYEVLNYEQENQEL